MSRRVSQHHSVRQVFAVFVFLCGLIAIAPLSKAQTFDATLLRQPAELGVPWLVAAGDDPA
jgi:hypothetical protein